MPTFCPEANAALHRGLPYSPEAISSKLSESHENPFVRGQKKITPRDYHFPESNRTQLSSGQCNTNIKAKRNQEEWRVIITVYLYSRHKIIVLEQLFGGHHNIIIYYLMALQNINARCPREHNWTGAKRIQLYWGQENTIVLGPREHNCSGPREHNCTENTIVLGPREHNWTGANRTQL